MTVNILIQIDKLVQLIESPVFTCEFPTTHDFTPANGQKTSDCSCLSLRNFPTCTNACTAF